MTGSRRSSRLHTVPEEYKPIYTEEQKYPKSLTGEDSIQGKKENIIKPPKKKVIGGSRRMGPGGGILPELSRVWAKKQMIFSSRPSPEVDDVKIDPGIGLMVNYRQKGRDKKATPLPLRWVPVQTACPKTVSAWAKIAKEHHEYVIKHLKKDKATSDSAEQLLLLEDLLDGEVIPPNKPDWMDDSQAEDQSTDIPLHSPHYPLPAPFNGPCANATQPSSILSHTNLVAACQASKHLPNGSSPGPTPHLVCTACHDNPPTQRLTQHERDHMIRDKGLSPLCPFCWVEMARARSRRADGCDECAILRTKREEKGENVIGEGVHMCSGCQALVVKQSQTPTA